MESHNLKVVASCRSYSLLAKDIPEFGPGVRTRDKGIPVEEIGRMWADDPDEMKIANELGTTPDHVRQSVDFCRYETLG